MPVFDSLLSKIQQVSLSNVNHELGKAKENLVYESGSYIENFKSDAAHVGSLIRSESTKFSNLFSGASKSGLPKSTSLPVLAGQITGLSSPVQDCHPCSERAKVLESKYKYRSTACGEENLVSPSDLVDQESVVNRFIRVVGAEDQKNAPQEPSSETAASKRKLSSREDIRRKLASFGEEEEPVKSGAKKGLQPSGNNNLQICFINETASDDEDVCLNPLAEETESETSEEEEEEEDRSVFPRSRSDWEAFRNPDLSKPVIEDDEGVTAEEAREQRARAREARKKRKIQAAARVALGQCKQVARRQMVLERQKRSAESPLRKLLGVDNSEINRKLLEGFNVATLQVIVNDFREKIECYNNELVEMLMEKDELQNEQDSMLMDMEDVARNG